MFFPDAGAREALDLADTMTWAEAQGAMLARVNATLVELDVPAVAPGCARFSLMDCGALGAPSKVCL